MPHIATRCIIQLNCIARGGVNIETWESCFAGPVEATTARYFLQYWYRELHGYLVPLFCPTDERPNPDEVIIRSVRGRVLSRWTIVDEMNARYRS